MHEIKLNNYHFNSTEEKSILASALEEGITINHSCLSGRCSTCKAKLVEGQVHSSIPQEGLSDREIDDGYILTCICKPLSNITLSAEGVLDFVLEKPKTIPAKIDSLKLLNEDVMEIVLRLPPNQHLTFKAGQYVNITAGSVTRSYSIASAPDERNLMFYIKNYSNGEFSTYLFEKAKEGDLLRIHGPLGTFFYRETEKKNIIFLNTGTGYAPVRSILKNLDAIGGVEGKSIFVISGNRRASDHVYNLELKNITATNLKLCSRESIEGFHEGYVQGYLISLGIDPNDMVVYACGSERMINSASKSLADYGLPQSCFYSDSFVLSK